MDKTSCVLIASSFGDEYWEYFPEFEQPILKSARKIGNIHPCGVFTCQLHVIYAKIVKLMSIRKRC